MSMMVVMAMMVVMVVLAGGKGGLPTDPKRSLRASENDSQLS